MVLCILKLRLKQNRNHKYTKKIYGVKKIINPLNINLKNI